MLLLLLLCGKKWANEACLGPNPQFRGKTHSESGKQSKLCVCAEPRMKKKNAVRLTKISLNAFNGAERAVSPRCMPVRAPFGFAV